MAINNPTWNHGTQGTSVILNQMVADGVNSTDDIHPQYQPVFWDGIRHKLYNYVPAVGYDYLKSTDTDISGVTNINMGGIQLFQSSNAIIGTAMFRKIASFQLNTLNWSCEVLSDLSDAEMKIQVLTISESSQLALTTKTSVADFPNSGTLFGPISGIADLTSVAQNDYISISLIMSLSFATTSKQIEAQKVKIWLS